MLLKFWTRILYLILFYVWCIAERKSSLCFFNVFLFFCCSMQFKIGIHSSVILSLILCCCMINDILININGRLPEVESICNELGLLSVNILYVEEVVNFSFMYFKNTYSSLMTFFRPKQGSNSNRLLKNIILYS
jgi:hypothetical protein